MPPVEPIYPQIGRRLQRIRKGHKPCISQEQMGEKIGLPRSAISAIESGRQRILAHTLIAICEVLDESIDSVLENIESEIIELKNTVFEGDSKESDINTMKRAVNRFRAVKKI